MQKNNTRHHLLIFLAALALFFLFLFTAVKTFGYFRQPADSSSTSRAESAPGSYINVLNWTSYLPADLISDFEQETGIRVNYSTYSSNEELLAKLTASKPGTYDLVFPSDYMLSLMRQKSLLSPLDKTRLSNLSNLDPRFLSQAFDEDNAYSLPFLLATTVFCYDESAVGPILSYKNLAADTLKNNVVLLDDQRIVIGAMLLASGSSMNDTADAHLSAAYDFYTRLRPNIKAFDSDSPKTFFITNEVDAGLIWNAEAVLAQAERPGLKISYPAEGFALSMDSFAIPVGAKNQDGVYKFIDFLLRPENADRIVAEYPYISPITSAQYLSSAELDEIFSRGSYVENLPGALEKFDKLWIKFK